MRFADSYTFDAARTEVWEALQDPAVLARTLPGCKQLEVTGEDQYAVTVTAGVAAVKGTYQGRVQLRDKQAPERYVMHASGQGGPGTIDATVEVELVEVDGGGTRVEYDVDATVGGTIAGVGQRVIQGASRKNATEFFDAVARELRGEAPAIEPGAAPEERRPAEVGQVFRGAERAAAPDTTRLLLALLLGAAIALAGVLVGRRTAR